MKPEGINSLSPRDLGLVVNKLDLTFPNIAFPLVCLREDSTVSWVGGVELNRRERPLTSHLAL